MIKKVVWHSAGIVRKQAELLHTWEDYNFYGLKEDFEDGEFPDFGTIYVDHNDHLFYVGHYKMLKDILVNEPGKIKMTMDKLEEFMLNEFNSSLKKAKNHTMCQINKGLAQYFNREQEADEVIKEYKEWKAITDEKIRVAQEEMRKEREKEEEEKLNLAIIEAENKLKNHEKIKADIFVELCKKYEVKLPIKLLGWIKKSLVDVGIDEEGYCYYSHRGNRSTSLCDYTKKLYEMVV